MAEIKKHVYDSAYKINHAMRWLPEGKYHGNEDIDVTLTKERNYSLLHGRFQTPKEANKYRKEVENELFKYNRKGLVKTIEIVIQCPDDCLDKKGFFETSYRYVCDKYLPMGERCVIVAQVHGDEHKYLKDEDGNYKLDDKGQKIDISKDHLHIIAVPGVPDKKHPDFEWKLSAHDLTLKGRLGKFHPGLQKALNDAGIKATVYQKKEGDGKTIGLTVKQLKEITNKTGIVLDKSLTVEQLAEILQENRDIKLHNKELEAKIESEIQKKSSISQEQIQHKDALISKLQETINLKDSSINNLRQQVVEKDTEITKIQSSTAEVIAQKDQQIQSLTTNISEKEKALVETTQQEQLLQQKIKDLEQQHQRDQERISDLEKEKVTTYEKEPSRQWGSTSTWGRDSSWGKTSRDNTITFGED